MTKQTKIDHFPVCSHFKYCRDLMLNMGLGKQSKEYYRMMADIKNLPCYDNDQSQCSKFRALEANGDRIQIRFPEEYTAKLETGQNSVFNGQPKAKMPCTEIKYVN